MSNLKVSFIFPVHNEAEFLEKQINFFIRCLGKNYLNLFEIILVENGSIDDSWKIISSLKKKFNFIRGLKLSKASYGQAVKQGMLASRGKYIFVYNVDFFDVEFFKKGLKLLKNFGIVVGSKTLAASKDNRSLLRRLITYFFNLFLRLVLNYPGTDTHGIKGFRNNKSLRKAINECWTINELFDTELIIRLTRVKQTLVELPVIVKELRPSRYSFAKRLWSILVDLRISLLARYAKSFSTGLVSGEDYGISDKVSQEIVKQALELKISVVSILPNMVSNSQIKSLKKLKSVIFSAHINLIEGRPISKVKEIKSLVKRNGNFYPLPIFFFRLLLGKIKVVEIEREALSQVKHLLALGVKIGQIDSHQHLHIFPPAWKVWVKVVKKLKIKRIRSRHSSMRYLKGWPIKYLIALLMSWSLSFVYGVNKKSSLEIDEKITHPGSNYDNKYLGKIIGFILFILIGGMIIGKKFYLPFCGDAAAFLIPTATDIGRGGDLLGYSECGTDYPHTFLLPLILAGVYRLPINFIFGAHAMSLIFSTGLLITIYYFGSYLFNKKVGLASSLLMLSNPLFLAQTLLVYFEIPGALFRLLSVLFLFKKKYLSFLLIALLAFLIRFENGVILVSVGLIYLCFVERQKRLGWFIKYLLPLIVANLVWYMIHYFKTGWWFYSPFRYFKENMFLAFSKSAKYLLILQGRSLVTILLVVLLSYSVIRGIDGFVLVLRKYYKELIILGVLFLWPFIIILKLGYFLPRYIFSVLPIFYLLVSGLVVKIFDNKKLMIGGIFLFLILFQIKERNTSFFDNKEDSLEVIELLETKKLASEYLQNFYTDWTIVVDSAEKIEELVNLDWGYVTEPLKAVGYENISSIIDDSRCLVYLSSAELNKLIFLVNKYEGRLVAKFGLGEIARTIYELPKCP